MNSTFKGCEQNDRKQQWIVKKLKYRILEICSCGIAVVQQRLRL